MYENFVIPVAEVAPPLASILIYSLILNCNIDHYNR